MTKSKEGTPKIASDTPKASSIEGIPAKEGAVLGARGQAEKTLKAERKIAAEQLVQYIMGLARDQEWHDEDGNVVGMVGVDGNSLKEHIESSLLRTGALLQAEEPEDLPKSILSKLKVSADLVGSSIGTIGTIKSLIDTFEEKIVKIKAKIEKDGGYLLDFKRGGSLRKDLEKAFHAMKNGQKHAGYLEENHMVAGQPTIDYFPDKKDKWKEMSERKSIELGRDAHFSEFEARLEMNEELRAEILDLVQKNESEIEIAKRIPALIYGAIDLICNSTASQLYGLFSDQKYEIGDTDAESMVTTLRGLNQSLAAIADIKKTRKFIPNLA